MPKNFCYEKLVKHHRELGVPWTDPAFPPSDASVGAAKVRQLGRKVEWKRLSRFVFVPGPANRNQIMNLCAQNRISFSHSHASCLTKFNFAMYV